MIAGLLAPGGSGGTFFDWSLHYLAGDEQHLVLNLLTNHTCEPIQEIWARVPNDPLESLTAHRHRKTHPSTLLQISTFFDVLRKKPQQDLFSFYFVDRMGPGVTSTCYREIALANADVQFFSFRFDETDISHLFALQIEKIKGTWHRYVTLTAGHKEPNNMPIWEQREMIALFYFECVRNQSVSGDLDDVQNHLCMNWKHFINAFDDYVITLLEWLDIRVDENRWAHWLDIYHKWQKTLSRDFFQCLPEILHNITNNVDYDLSRFNMSTAKEIVIEHLLIQEHGVCLRSFGLLCMPNNTRDWHALLEPNIYHKTSEKAAERGFL